MKVHYIKIRLHVLIFTKVLIITTTIEFFFKHSELSNVFDDNGFTNNLPIPVFRQIYNIHQLFWHIYVHTHQIKT